LCGSIELDTGIHLVPRVMTLMIWTPVGFSGVVKLFQVKLLYHKRCSIWQEYPLLYRK